MGASEAMAEQPVDLASGLVRLDEDAGGSWRLYSGIAQGGKSKRRSFGVDDDDSILGDVGGRSEVDVSHGIAGSDEATGVSVWDAVRNISLILSLGRDNSNAEVCAFSSHHSRCHCTTTRYERAQVRVGEE